jgi:hypothetical protein
MYQARSSTDRSKTTTALYLNNRILANIAYYYPRLRIDATDKLQEPQRVPGNDRFPIGQMIHHVSSTWRQRLSSRQEEFPAHGSRNSPV